MQNEIVKLLKKEGKLSEKTIDELSNIDVQPEFIKNRIRSLPEQLELLLDFNQG